MDFSKIIDACGELARGFKKLKAELVKLSKQSRSEKKGAKVPFMVALDEPDNDEKVQETAFSDSLNPDLGDTLFWLGRKCCWGITHAHDVATYMVGENWRGDRFRNLWRLRRVDCIPEVAHNWIPASETEFEHLYTVYLTMLTETYDALVDAQRDKNPIWTSIRSSKRKRFYNIRDATITPLDKKAFRKILVDNHRSLPALRGRN